MKDGTPKRVSDSRAVNQPMELPTISTTRSSYDKVVRTGEADLPTRHGHFRIATFRDDGEPSESIAVIGGDLRTVPAPLVRLHSECLTGDALGSIRCDCGEQLDAALSLIAESSGGVLLYLRQEGRGIGLANKIRAYALQDSGMDTVDANTALGLPVDGREYSSAAAVLRHLGVERVRLLTNNPAKCQALERHGIAVIERVPLETAPHAMNQSYLHTKATRMGHLLSLVAQDEQAEQANNASLPVGRQVNAWRLARGRRRIGHPYVTIHYAQTLDGRIATRSGNSQWISGKASLCFAHELRATHQAVIVGIGTVLADNPRLTVRHAPGPSPMRVILDSTLRLPHDTHVLTDDAAPTLVATTTRAPEERIEAIRARGAEVLLFEPNADGRVDLAALMRHLGERGVVSVLIEGGANVITSALRNSLVDRLVVCIAPKMVGAGIEAVGNLDVLHLSDALTFAQARFTHVGEDIIFDGQLNGSSQTAE